MANTPRERLGEIQRKGVRVCTDEEESGLTSCPLKETASTE